MRKFPAAVIFKGFPGALHLPFNACQNPCKVGSKQVSGIFSFAVFDCTHSWLTKGNVPFGPTDAITATSLCQEKPRVGGPVHEIAGEKVRSLWLFSFLFAWSCFLSSCHEPACLWTLSFQNKRVGERVEFCFSKRELLVFSDLADDFACLLVAAGRRELQPKESAWT